LGIRKGEKSLESALDVLPVLLGFSNYAAFWEEAPKVIVPLAASFEQPGNEQGKAFCASVSSVLICPMTYIL